MGSTATMIWSLFRPASRNNASYLVNFNPHVHVLAADGAFLPDGRFVTLPAVPGSLLAGGFRRAVLDFLVNNDALSEGLRSRRLGWRHSGFSAHNEVRVPAEDAEGRKKLAGYMLRASGAGVASIPFWPASDCPRMAALRPDVHRSASGAPRASCLSIPRSFAKPVWMPHPRLSRVVRARS
jgi:hypothetical protein